MPERGADRSPRWALIRRAAAAAAVAVLLWLIGHETVAIVLVVVMGSLTLLAARVPAVARRMERIEHAIQHWAGRGLTYVLMAFMQLLVFTPIFLVLRLVRHDPLALGRVSSETAWRPAAIRRGKPLYKRPYAYEVLAEPHAGRGMRFRAALGIVALLLLLDLGIGAAIHAIGDEPSAAERQSLLTLPDAPAGRAEPWRHDLSAELDEFWRQSEFDPYLGWTSPDYSGRLVNVSGGMRRSYQPAGDGEPVKVFFFGGSAMFGLFQRDGHTIPSEVARLAERDGIRLRVSNYGRLAYVNWQEALLLQERVARGERPDLAVFYDGFNEILGQFQLGPHSDPSHLQADSMRSRLEETEPDERSPLTKLFDAWGGVSAAHEAGRELGMGGKAPGGVFMRSAWQGDQADRPERRGRLAADLYARGTDVIESVAGTRGFEARFFWQPSIYTKRQIEGEEQFQGWLGADPEAWRAANRAARARNGPGVDDLGRSLDGVRQPVMYDFVHTNELGARTVAEALYRRLRPTLLRLSRGQSP
ncbi:MAG: hypothetical protein JW895_17340 [Thermoleophilaceae bacterium]|nr:hypothetical protein [Thermoleophilaceae bacterium]